MLKENAFLGDYEKTGRKYKKKINFLYLSLKRKYKIKYSIFKPSGLVRFQIANDRVEPRNRSNRFSGSFFLGVMPISSFPRQAAGLNGVLCHWVWTQLSFHSTLLLSTKIKPF